MIKPITPKEALEAKQKTIPSKVIKIFNELIIENLKNGEAVIDQDVVSLKISKSLKLPESEIFKKGFLDIEKHYDEVGWEVIYNKPGYNEDYSATFIFSIKNKKG